MIKNKEVYLYKYEDHWRDVGTLASYWESNLELTKSIPELNLYCEEWKLHTRSEEKSPAKFGKEGRSCCSLISNGAIINGEVSHSIISPGVYIEKGAVVKNSIIFNNTKTRSGSFIYKSIIDKEVEIKENCKIGNGDDYTANKLKPDLLENGLNIIGKGAKIPKNTVLDRNCRIYPYVNPKNFNERKISSGSTISSKSGKNF